MKASKENTKKTSEKGVSFDALETIDRHSDSMNKLASLVSKLDMKLDKKETLYIPKVYHGRNRGCRQRQDNYRSRDRSYSMDHGQYNYRGRRNYNYNNNNRNYRSNYRNRDRSRNGYENRRNHGENYRRDSYRQHNGTKGIEIGVQVSTMVGLGKDIGVPHGITQIQEIDTVIVETKAEVDRGPNLVTGKIVEQGVDQAHM